MRVEAGDLGPGRGEARAKRSDRGQGNEPARISKKARRGHGRKTIQSPDELRQQLPRVTGADAAN